MKVVNCMNEDVINIFESEFEYKAFMIQIANDYEKIYFRKSGNFFYYIKDDEQLFAIAKAYKEFLDNSDEKAYKEKFKNIFANSPVKKFPPPEGEFTFVKKYTRFELVIMSALAVFSFCYAIFFAEVLTERIVLSMSGAFLLISPILALRANFSKDNKK